MGDKWFVLSHKVWTARLVYEDVVVIRFDAGLIGSNLWKIPVESFNIMVILVLAIVLFYQYSPLFYQFSPSFMTLPSIQTRPV